MILSLSVELCQSSSVGVLARLHRSAGGHHLRGAAATGLKRYEEEVGPLSSERSSHQRSTGDITWCGSWSGGSIGFGVSGPTGKRTLPHVDAVVPEAAW